MWRNPVRDRVARADGYAFVNAVRDVLGLDPIPYTTAGRCVRDEDAKSHLRHWARARESL
jgi:hypothetical protein